MINLIIIGILTWNLLASIFLKPSKSALYCGLIGFSGASPCSIDKIKLLYMYNKSRGIDSTGYYNGDDICKDNTPADEFLAKWTLPVSKLVIGHTRFGTYGGKGKAQAHPFQYGNVVGAHNGKVENLTFLKEKRNIPWNKFDVDSEILFYCLNEEHNFKILQDFYGPGAVLFHNKHPKEVPNALYAYRNSERPLHYGMINGGMYISSLPDSLSAIGLAYNQIHEFKEGRVNKIVDGKIVEFWKIKKSLNMNFPLAPKSVHSYNYWDDGGRRVDSHNNYRRLSYAGKASAYTPKNTGKTKVWVTANGCLEQRLPNGNTLIGSVPQKNKPVPPELDPEYNNWDCNMQEPIEVVDVISDIHYCDIKNSNYNGKLVDTRNEFCLYTGMAWDIVDNDEELKDTLLYTGGNISYAKLYFINGERVTWKEYHNFRQTTPYKEPELALALPETSKKVVGEDCRSCDTSPKRMSSSQQVLKLKVEELQNDEKQKQLGGKVYFKIDDMCWYRTGHKYTGKYEGDDAGMQGSWIFKGKRCETEAQYTRQYNLELAKGNTQIRNVIIKTAQKLIESVKEAENTSTNDVAQTVEIEEEMLQIFNEATTELIELVDLYKDVQTELSKTLLNIITIHIFAMEKEFNNRIKGLNYADGTPAYEVEELVIA